MEEGADSARQSDQRFDALRPVTIVRVRYGGLHEPGDWLAFPALPDQLPAEWDADDINAMDFYARRSGEIGGGRTPNEAYDDLVRKQGVRRAERPPC